jgi:hypothetical protein
MVNIIIAFSFLPLSRQIDLHRQWWWRQQIPRSHATSQCHQSRTFVIVSIEGPLADGMRVIYVQFYLMVLKKKWKFEHRKHWLTQCPIHTPSEVLVCCYVQPLFCCVSQMLISWCKSVIGQPWFLFPPTHSVQEKRDTNQRGFLYPRPSSWNLTCL